MGGTLLRYTARYGLLRSCMTLLEAKVSINSVRRTKTHTGYVYHTALDEALDETGTSPHNDVGIPEPNPEQGISYRFETKLKEAGPPLFFSPLSLPLSASIM